MSDKPKKAAGYSPDMTLACETLLVLLLRAFGELGSGLRLIGGLVPRYLAPESPPDVPAHVGSNDVDVVLDVAVLAGLQTPGDLRARLENAGFAPFQNGKGGESRWQWEREIDGNWMRVDLLVNTTDFQDFKQVPIADGSLFAGGMPFAAMATDWCRERSLTVALPDGGETATEVVRHADAGAFIALKALALGRQEPKDVADIVHVLRYLPGSWSALSALFVERLRPRGPYQQALRTALDALDLHFCDDAQTEGFLKDGPSRFSEFHDILDEDERLLEQRNVSALVTAFLGSVEASGAWAFNKGRRSVRMTGRPGRIPRRAGALR
ncbi:hypothetical protein LRH25_16775 [Ideonella azotifigens]|uniref:Nucleotidyltransferase family protein n=1 Tax=Ideonella azotifigens TaxID=513160 RepID=A0ABN1JJ36_9BURK|nr:hypothetical protein [Ideonella azotifigens]MCD2341995.1 hypothetical protein [Ideonella azotifigens]